MRIHSIATIFMISLFSNAIAEPAMESHERLSQLVHEFLLNKFDVIANTNLEVEVGRIDRRLQLVKCDQAVTINNSTATTKISSRISVEVSCNGKIPWSFYVPVQLKRLAYVFATIHSINKGKAITRDDLQLVTIDTLKTRAGYFNNTADLIGMIAKKNIRMGVVLNKYHVRPPTIINKGDKVDILAKTGEMEIRMAGKALSAGAKGQRIGVTNLSSKRNIQATVVKPGLVKVNL